MPCLNTYGPNNEMRTCEPDPDNPNLCKRTALTGARHNLKCAIQWIDESGNPTPDYNDAIGMCWVTAHDHPSHTGHCPESAHHPICAEHAKQFETYPTREKLINSHWKFVPLAQYTPPER